ncbi:hypothetical protein N7447_010153 [Penicillium robsamsonii]|uniref:uncharacterized protein n=1 Tax=Penicillium robsamsonii TaxID=1792511 RepID=UPI002546F0AD|nr:uncharacterized protein N7447_010153 [Penicillium robsamsonii]KAJ5813130.1 hypothetical protein N7447_010153 [Penicillium robsamsonii]
MKGTLILSGLLATAVSAHMQLSKPYPIRSPLNKDGKGEKDYSYTNPLSTSGSDYPCKGYAKDKFEAVATWQPGSTQEMTLEGSAVHGGGSCQLALTYDQGETFKVIESIEGDCPIDKKYEFQVPSDAPSGDALFAWTWFNKVGNREMYMNCAMVTIGGSAKRSATVESEGNNDQTENAKSDFSSLPELFVANVNQAGKCVTIEGQAVHFPKPGPKVIGKADGPGYKCSDHAPFLGSSKSEKQPAVSDTTKSNKKPATTLTTATKSEKNPTAESTTATKSKNKPTADSTTTPTKSEKNAVADIIATHIANAVSKITKAFGTAAADDDSRLTSTKHSANNQFSDYVGQWSCHSGDIICAPDGLSFALCTNGKPIFMGSVAAGTICRSGVITARQ